MKGKTRLQYYENHQYPWPGLVASELSLFKTFKLLCFFFS